MIRPKTKLALACETRGFIELQIDRQGSATKRKGSCGRDAARSRGVRARRMPALNLARGTRGTCSGWQQRACIFVALDNACS
jgi:hypothetical protein